MFYRNVGHVVGRCYLDIVPLDMSTQLQGKCVLNMSLVLSSSIVVQPLHDGPSGRNWEEVIT